MLLTAIPLILWCISLINGATLDSYFTYAVVGCFAAAILYTYSMVVAKLDWCLPGGPIIIVGAEGWHMSN